MYASLEVKKSNNKFDQKFSDADAESLIGKERFEYLDDIYLGNCFISMSFGENVSETAGKLSDIYTLKDISIISIVNELNRMDISDDVIQGFVHSFTLQDYLDNLSQNYEKKAFIYFWTTDLGENRDLADNNLSDSFYVVEKEEFFHPYFSDDRITTLYHLNISGIVKHFLKMCDD